MDVCCSRQRDKNSPLVPFVDHKPVSCIVRPLSRRRRWAILVSNWVSNTELLKMVQLWHFKCQLHEQGGSNHLTCLRVVRTPCYLHCITLLLLHSLRLKLELYRLSTRTRSLPLTDYWSSTLHPLPPKTLKEPFSTKARVPILKISVSLNNSNLFLKCWCLFVCWKPSFIPHPELLGGSIIFPPLYSLQASVRTRLLCSRENIHSSPTSPPVILWQDRCPRGNCGGGNTSTDVEVGLWHKVNTKLLPADEVRFQIWTKMLTHKRSFCWKNCSNTQNQTFFWLHLRTETQFFQKEANNWSRENKFVMFLTLATKVQVTLTWCENNDQTQILKRRMENANNS